MGKKQLNKQMNKKKKKHRGLKVLLVILVLLILAGGWFAYKTHKNGGGLSGMLATVVGHDENTKKNLGELKVLLLGISTDLGDSELTDTIIVASYNPNTQKATLLSIPRDTYVGSNPNKATGGQKINALYSYNNSPKATLEAVNKITGLDIQYYVVIKNEALIKLVDAIGGVTFNVPRDMNYDDPTQNLHIHLEKGEQLLDGDKAEQLVRYRHDNWDPVTKSYPTYPAEYGDNDTGRMRTQREFIMQVLKQTLKPENIFKIGQILDIASENVITNIDLGVAKDYIPYAVEFNTENLITGTLPGENTNKNENGVWVFVYDKTETKELVQELFYDRDAVYLENEENTNTTENTINTTNSSTVTNNTSAANSTASTIKIEVLNGSGTDSYLEDVVTKLKNEGYNVTKKGNTTSTLKTTIINKKTVKSSDLNELKELLGLGVISNSKSNSSKVDVTVVIGKDYK